MKFILIIAILTRKLYIEVKLGRKEIVDKYFVTNINVCQMYL